MSVGEYCNREVTIVEKGEPVRAAIELMRDQHVGDVVVIERHGDQAKPLGILTDRDIVVGILAENVDMDAVSIGDVMSYELAVIRDDASLLEAIALMKQKGVRRLPVVNARGFLAGIITVDDMLELIGEQVAGLVSLVNREQLREQRVRR